MYSYRCIYNVCAHARTRVSVLQLAKCRCGRDSFSFTVVEFELGALFSISVLICSLTIKFLLMEYVQELYMQCPDHALKRNRVLLFPHFFPHQLEY